MKRFFTKSVLSTVILLSCFIHTAWGQTTSISGTVKDKDNGETLAGVNIVVKGKVIGTITNPNGEFSFTVNSAPPMTITASFIGFTTQEFEITDANTSGLDIVLAEESLLGQEVVISASRVEESILRSPVSIEKMDIRAIQDAATPSFYDAIRNLKGIDVSSQSITFKSINPRGFGANGNTRTVQLIDGIDNQAPGLNFPLGNIVGISELDLESVEILSGASSALYGPNAIQGIILMNSKSPFDYQGLSTTVKIGVNHLDGEDDDASLYKDFSLRYAKAFNNKFAFKITGSFLQANDFRPVDYRDQNGIVENSEDFDPSQDGYRDGARTYNGVNIYGEPTVNLGEVADGVIAGGGVAGATISALRPLFPNGPEGNFTPRGFTPREFVDNNTESLKLGTALHYRLNDKVEALGQFNYGKGSTVYTANDRFVLDGFSIWTAKLELRGSNFFVRAYKTQENSGDTYAANTLASRINQVSSIPNYFGAFAAARGPGIPGVIDGGQSVDASHAFARANENRLEVGSDDYNTKFDSIRALPISEGGAKFLDKTSMTHFEGMYNFADKISFAEVIVGANYRTYNLNSEGTLFALTDVDTGDEFSINEYGGYVQLQRSAADGKLGLSGSVRYDKNENFDGQFTPRLSAVYSMGADRQHNVRASFQSGFRVPTTQAQYINLDVVTRRLLGGTRALVDLFHLEDNPIYSLSQLEAVRNGEANISTIVPFTDFNLETEKVNTYEIGYKSLISNRLLIDASFYYSQYTDFILVTDFIQTRTDLNNIGTPINDGQAASIVDIVDENIPLTRYGYRVNSDEIVNAQGFVFGADYSLPKGYQIGGNVSYNKLLDANELKEKGFISEFNTPEYKYNLKFANRKVTDKFGFSINYRWQDAFLWESAIGQGVIPAFSTVDAQVSYRLKNLKSVLKLGGSNLLNERYTTSFANPRNGAIYYISITFDEFFN